MTPEDALLIVWALWAVSWVAAAFWTESTIKRPQMREEFLYRALTLLGFLSLFALYEYRGPLHWWTLPDDIQWLLVIFGALCCGFAWWARIHLGKLWSGRVTRKVGHTVIDTGPYAYVRHPIYTGIIGAGLALAAVKGTAVAGFGALLLIAGYWIKAKFEERFLREELGPEFYDAYRRKVPLLVPFGPKMP